MTRATTGWRRIRGLMAALVLAVLVLGPGMDAYVCRDEGVPSATAASSAVVAAQDAAIHTDAGHAEDGDGLGPCAHGHCHPVFFTSPHSAQIGEAKAVTQRLLPPQASVVRSDMQFGLMRPPRA